MMVALDGDVGDLGFSHLDADDTGGEFLDEVGDAALFFDGLNANDAVAPVHALADSKLRETLISNGQALVKTRSSDLSVAKINEALNHFAKKRRLWGPSNSYRHT